MNTMGLFPGSTILTLDKSSYLESNSVISLSRNFIGCNNFKTNFEEFKNTIYFSLSTELKNKN
jgi:hypothetical protein